MPYKLNLKRFLQEPGECAIAAVSSVANFFDKDITYDLVRSIAKPDGEGLYTPAIGMLLNTLGFNSVSVVSADLNSLDFSWANLDQPALAKEMAKVARYSEDEGYRESAREYVQFLNSDYCNELIIDRHFGRYIRKYVAEGFPVLASFNWNLFFEFPKWNDRNCEDPIKGETEEHEVVIYGYDDRGVLVLDSHHELYTGRLKKYQRGRYRMDWETLMTVMGFGDLIIAGDYQKRDLNELVQVGTK